MASLRIALFSEVFLPKVDGIVNTLCRMLDHFQDRGHASLLFAPEGGPDRYAATQVIGLGASNFPLYPELRLVSPFVDIQSILDDFKPDLVHVINPITLGLAGIWYAQRVERERCRHIPLVASFHTDLPGFAERWGLGFLNPAIWSLILTVHKQADLNLAPSRITRRALVARGMPNVRVWSRGVDSSLFSPHRRSAEWRMRLSNHHPQAPLLLSVGRLSAEKRIDWLGAVLETYPQTRLAIVGDGPQRPELEEQFGRFDDRVVFTGFLRGEQLAQAYASADLFVFTGANETFGNVVLEAMASGLPVIAPDSGGVLDVVRHNESGLLFHAEEPDSLVYQTGRLLRDSRMAERFARSARKSAEMRSWKAAFDVLEQEYLRLVDRWEHPAMQPSLHEAQREHIYDRQPHVW